MKCKIEIEEGNRGEPVAFVSDTGAVYWPGKNGACLSPAADGEKMSCNYSHVDFNTLPGYKPLYKGDVIRVIKEIVL